MKYRFNKIFPLLIKPQENAEIFILAPIWVCWALIWVPKYFLEVSALLYVTHCPKL